MSEDQLRRKRAWDKHDNDKIDRQLRDELRYEGNLQDFSLEEKQEIKYKILYKRDNEEIERQLIELRYDGNLQDFSLEEKKEIKQQIENIKRSPKNNNLNERKEIIEEITESCWRNHENYSMEKLIEIRLMIIKYFRIFKISFDYECKELPNIIEKYDLEEFKIIIEDFEKRVSAKNPNKRRNDAMWDKTNISKKEIIRKEIQKKIKPWITVDVKSIAYEDLEYLSYTIDSIKKYGKIPNVSGLEDAKLVFLNCEIEAYGGKIKDNILDARKYLEYLETREIIIRKFPDRILSDDRDEIMKIYSEEIVPKNYPSNPNLRKEWIDKQLYRFENSGIGYTPGDFHESHK